MKSSIAFAIAALIAAGAALAQSDAPQLRRTPAQLAQASGGGASTGAGEATGAASTALSAGTIVAMAAGVAVVVAASGQHSDTHSVPVVVYH